MMRHKGWHSRGYLPHFDTREAVQFVTFRLGDSLPAEAIAGIEQSDRPESTRDKFLDRLGRHRRMDHQQIRDGANE